jgi:ribosomal protein L34
LARLIKVAAAIALAALIILLLFADQARRRDQRVGLNLVPRTVLADRCCATKSGRVDVANDLRRATAFEPLKSLMQAVPRTGQPPGAATNADYDLRDSHGLQMDVLSIAPLPGDTKGPSCTLKYVGVYHLTLPEPTDGAGSDFALRVAESCDLMTWTYRTTLVTHGASQGDIHELPDGGFLVAYEQQTRDRSGAVRRNNITVLHYASLDALLHATAEDALTIPRLLARGAPPHPNSEGTPNFRSIRWNGSINTSKVTLGFHYLARLTSASGRGVLADRQARGTLDRGRWTDVVAERPIDQALERAGFRGSHGGRSDFTFQRRRWRIIEARAATTDDWNVSWRLLLYRPAGRRTPALLTRLTPRTRDTITFANPKARLLRSPNGTGNVLVVTTLARGRGQLLYYVPQP